jgi:hypothetical protein
MEKSKHLINTPQEAHTSIMFYLHHSDRKGPEEDHAQCFFYKFSFIERVAPMKYKVQHFRPDFGWNHHNLMKICSNG